MTDITARKFEKFLKENDVELQEVVDYLKNYHNVMIDDINILVDNIKEIEARVTQLETFH